MQREVTKRRVLDDDDGWNHHQALSSSSIIQISSRVCILLTHTQFYARLYFVGFRAGVLVEPLKGILYPFVSGGGDVETLAAGSRREIWKLEKEISKK